MKLLSTKFILSYLVIYKTFLKDNIKNNILWQYFNANYLLL
jgi:hypothetical protein